MRARVLAAVDELGYVPKHAAQSLANGTSQTIAVLVPDLSIGFFNAVVSSVDRAAMAEGYSVLLGATGWDGGDSEVRYLRMLKARAVDGLIYATGGVRASREIWADLIEALPAVALDEELPDWWNPRRLRQPRRRSRCGATPGQPRSPKSDCARPTTRADDRRRAVRGLSRGVEEPAMR